MLESELREGEWWSGVIARRSDILASEPMAAGRATMLSEGEDHARMHGSRSATGWLVDGAGGVGRGNVVKLGKAQMVEVDLLDRIEPLPGDCRLVPTRIVTGCCSWREGDESSPPSLATRNVAALSSMCRARRGDVFQDAAPRRWPARSRSAAAVASRDLPHAPPDRAVAACPAGAQWLLDKDGEPLPANADLLRRSRWRSGRKEDSSRVSARIFWRPV